MISLSRLPLAALSLLVFALALTTPQLHAVSRPWIGIYMQDVNADLADAFSLHVKKGVLVSDVLDDSPAQKAGLREKDVILIFDGKEVGHSEELSELVKAKKPGDKITLKIDRDGKDMAVAIIVGEREEAREYDLGNAPRARGFSWMEQFKTTGIGVSLQSLSGDLGEYFGVPGGEGALITEVLKDTPAARAGLKVGDVIVAVDGDRVEGPSDVSEALSEKKKGDQADLKVIRDKQEMALKVEVDEIESLGSMDLRQFRAPDRMPNAGMPRWFHFNLPESDAPGDFGDQMEELQRQMEKLEKRLQELESRMK